MNEARRSALLHEQPYLAEFSYMTDWVDGFSFTSPQFNYFIQQLRHVSSTIMTGLRWHMRCD
jgi:hypothetical protein